MIEHTGYEVVAARRSGRGIWEPDVDYVIARSLQRCAVISDGRRKPSTKRPLNAPKRSWRSWLWGLRVPEVPRRWANAGRLPKIRERPGQLHPCSNASPIERLTPATPG